MRIFFLIFAVLWAVIGSGPAIAEEIPGHPGWSITSYESSDRLDGDGNPVQFYSLQPPGGRSAINIDAGVAASLRSGSITPESVYGGSGEQAGDDNTFDLGRPRPSSLSRLGGSGIVSGGAISAPSQPAANSAVQTANGSPSFEYPSLPSGGPHSPQRPQAMSAGATGTAGGGDLLHDIHDRAIPVGSRPLAVNGGGGGLEAHGGTGNGGGHPGETPTGDGSTATTNSPAGDPPPNTPVNSTTSTATLYGDGVRCVGGGADEQTRVAVTFSASAITSASYVFKDCKPDATAIDPARITVSSGSTIVVNGKVLHLEK